jgi:hypothetical protein
MLDTGACIPESKETLLFQQQQLKSGKRNAQMFPVSTCELDLPDGFWRHVNLRGVFHFNPRKLTSGEIDFLSLQGKENEILNLGPYNKVDIARRVQNGEKIVFVTEYTPEKLEIRSAVGTNRTITEQLLYFESSREENSVIVVGPPPNRVLELWIKDLENGY